MSVVITLKFQGDVATFRQAIVEHADDFTKMAAEARASGGGSTTARSALKNAHRPRGTAGTEAG